MAKEVPFFNKTKTIGYMKKRKKIYVSLPISGYDIEERKAYAAQRKKDLLSLFRDVFTDNIVVEVVTPFEVCTDPDKSYSYYMGRDIEALLDCDAILMCQGWEKSKGCQLERYTADLYGKEIVCLNDDTVAEMLESDRKMRIFDKE